MSVLGFNMALVLGHSDCKNTLSKDLTGSLENSRECGGRAHL